MDYSEKREYFKEQNSIRRERKRIWQWNKRHPDNPIPYEDEPPRKRQGYKRTDYARVESQSFGNEKWQQLGEEDRQWRLNRMQIN